MIITIMLSPIVKAVKPKILALLTNHSGGGGASRFSNLFVSTKI
jgi:hypothetical protein